MVQQQPAGLLPPNGGLNPFFGQNVAPGFIPQGAQAPGGINQPQGQGNVAGLGNLDVVQQAIQRNIQGSNNIAQALQSLDTQIGADGLAGLNNSAQKLGLDLTAYDVAIKGAQAFQRQIKQSASGWFA